MADRDEKDYQEKMKLNEMKAIDVNIEESAKEDEVHFKKSKRRLK